jgi:hypothetical protein
MTTNLLTPRPYGSQKYKPAPVVFDIPEFICAATSREPLSLKKLWAGSALRPNCQDFLKFPSRGGC